MYRTTLIIIFLVLGATGVNAGTFNPTPYYADAGVDVLTRSVANTVVDRDLFGEPYATTVIGNVDVYDRFPFLEARYFQVVSDPAWNRLLLGEVGQGLASYDGADSPFGPLASPRGLSADSQGRIYVADTENDRVLVFQTITEFDQIELEPLYDLTDLSRPYDVAHSDAGTPFDGSDDRLYVVNSGRNEVLRFTLSDTEARLTASLGTRGNDPGQFAGPLAITVGHQDGYHSNYIYVADSHNGRIVKLRDTGSGLAWVGSEPHDLGLITSLDTDHWGHLYAAAPQRDAVAKFTPALIPVASLTGNITRPRSFHVPFVNVHDHRNGQVTRTGQGSGILVEEWAGESGIRLLNLGVELTNPVPVTDNGIGVQLTLTDQADVQAELIDPRTGNVVARHDAGRLDAGHRTVQFAAADFMSDYPGGEFSLTVTARSTYDEGGSDSIQLTVHTEGGSGSALPDRLTLLGNAPNPFNPATTIRFLVPQGPAMTLSMKIYDARGRLVRAYSRGQVEPGLQEIEWDGRRHDGSAAGSGLYLYRVKLGQEMQTGKMVLVK
jgi:DNA-binding beta-propeller fold protein YncE